MESGKDNMFRFLCLYTEVVAKVLRCRLKQSYKNSNVQTFSSFLKDADILHTIFHLFFSVHSCCWRGCRTHTSRVLSKKQWDILYDSDPSRCCKTSQNDPNKICLCCITPKHVDEDDIDLSLLSFILINCCNLMPNEKEAVQKLRDTKNENISHNPKCSLTNSDFESLWNNSEYYIKHLDSTNIYLNTRENVLNRPMDESLMQKYFVESVKMKHEIKSVHASIDRGNENVLEAIKELRDDVVHYKTTKRKRHEFTECSYISNEQDSTEDDISQHTKVQKLQKPFVWYNNKEFISSKLVGSNLSTSVSLQMDHTIFTVKDLSKRSDFEKMDKHICGKCGWLFVSLDQFLQHKEECKIRQKENEFVKKEYNKYILSRITIPTKDQELSHRIVTDWQQGKLESKYYSMEVNYMTIGCVDIWIKVDVPLYLDIKHFYSALDELVNGILQKYSVEAPLYHVKVFDIATGYVDHINDESCCGDCKLKCNTLDEFISHKNTKCFQHSCVEDENQCRELLASYTDTIFKDSKLHLRLTHLLSNTNDKEQAFRKLRNEIFTTASNSQNWNREYPVKFIQIEKAINSELTTGKQIIAFDRVKELGANISIPITDNKELRLFLRFQHEVGNLIYYEDIPSYIILDPQWLVNAFKCIVTAHQFQLELPHLQWEELKQTGRLDLNLLDAIFKKQSTEMIIYKEHILEVIEKFDIIIHPSLLSGNGKIQKEACFYVPCMIQKSKIEIIDKVFNVPDSCKSTCLCFVFRFLPPHLISNLFVSCLRAYPLAAVKGQLGISKDSCVFNISKTGCEKFVLSKSNHMIELQIWQWNKPNLMKNQEVLQFVEIEINRIVNTRYKLKTVSFEKKWKCETTSYTFDKGCHKLDDVLDGENYYCEEHATMHRYKDYWSGEKSKAPMRMSSDQQNYSRMSMIVLEVLSGVLYDRLYIDTKTGEILDRDKLDITEMCKKYCALNMNFPSKGYRKIEKVDEISTNEDTIGDDIQRIRVINNEMQHSTVFALDDTRYKTLITIVHDMLTRFDLRNNPAGESYVKRLDEIRKIELETRSFGEIKERMKAGFIEKIHVAFDRVVSDALNDIC